MELRNVKMPFGFQHAITDYLRVAVIAVIVLITFFIVRMIGNRPADGKQKILENEGVTSLVDRNQ